MKFRVPSAVLAAAIAASSPARASIGIFADPDGANCNASALFVVPYSIYVLYLPDGGPAAVGAEYRITGHPGFFNGTYIATLIAAPGSTLNLGNAFDDVGHNVAWPIPQPFDSNGNLLLATYNMIEIAQPVPAMSLRVVGRQPPTNANFPCPLIADAGFNLICQAGGEMSINGSYNCTVAVESNTWTGIRNLYR